MVILSMNFKLSDKLDILDVFHNNSKYCEIDEL